MPKLGKVLDIAKLADLDDAARLRRAAEQGFDTNKVWYHGTDADVTAFDPTLAGTKKTSDWGEGVYLSPDPGSAAYYAQEAAMTNDTIGDALYKAYEKVAKDNGTRPMYEYIDLGSKKDAVSQAKYKKVKDAFAKWEGHREELRNTAGGAVYPVYVRGKPMQYQYEGITDHTLPWQAASEGKDWVQVGRRSGDKFLAEEALVMDPRNIRSVNAQFDPTKTDSSNILAGAVGAGVLGAVASQDAEAAPMGTLKNMAKIATRRAHHGSPYDFDKFDITKIGTGEGAQAYGHGLYFSSSEDIARGYRDRLSQNVVIARDGQSIANNDLGKAIYRGAFGETNDKTLLSAITGDRKSEIAEQVAEGLRQGDDTAHMKKFVRQSDWDADEKDLWNKALNAADNYTSIENPGKLYEVEIPDEFNMLDWDKPLSEQPELLDALKDVGIRQGNGFIEVNGKMLESGSTLTGREGYKALAMSLGGDELASAKLRELGIPGITYKGGTSGERNFVVFDDSMVNLVDKRQIPIAPIATAALGGYAATQSSPASAEEVADFNNASLMKEYARPIIDDWRARRAGKRKDPNALNYLEGAALMGSGVLGGIGGAIAELGGNLSPYVTPEQAARSSQIIQDATTWQPSPGAAEAIRPVIRGLQGFSEDVVDPTVRRYNQQAPWIKEGYDALPPRMKGIMTGLSGLL